MTLNAHILLVDDDKMLSPFIQEYLESKGLKVTLVYSGEDGLHTFRQGHFDLCILDVKMPFKDGFTLAAELRDLDADVPFIFLSSNADKAHRIKGLTLGADDYVPKPFSMEELYLRIAAVLRRVGRQQEQEQVAEAAEYTIGQFSFHPQNQELSLGTNVQSLTGTEAKLLLLFATAPDGVLSRDNALKSIWGEEEYLRGRSLNVYVSKLRQLLKADPSIEIKNIHGTGYRLHIRG
jgi:DNA-binding response OmpR family regulator